MIAAAILGGKMANRSCDKCAIQPDLKEAWACEEQEEPAWVLFEGEPDELRLYQCPMAGINKVTERIVEMYGDFKHGIFPYLGGRPEQPIALLSAFRFLDRTIQRIEHRG